MATERIQKVLSAAGCGARRACEELVLDGRVSVNGKVVRTLPVLVDPAVDRIYVDGRRLSAARPVYYLLNKPRGVFCTQNDPAGRTLATDLLVGVRERVFPVGRLDADSTGLLILTNDGDLAQKLTHPRFGVPKTYRVEVDGRPDAASLVRLREGVWLSEGKTGAAGVRVVHGERNKAVLEITLREGRNREIRRIMAKIGYRTHRLSRIGIGRLSIRGLPLGAYRRLTPQEVSYLQSLAEQSAVKAKARRRPPSAERGKKRGRRRGAASAERDRPQLAASCDSSDSPNARVGQKPRPASRRQPTPKGRPSPKPRRDSKRSVVSKSPVGSGARAGSKTPGGSRRPRRRILRPDS